VLAVTEVVARRFAGIRGRANGDCRPIGNVPNDGKKNPMPGAD